MLLENYQDNNQQVQNVTGSWIYRGLSIYGMLIMLNALVGSLLVCKMNVLRLIPQNIIDAVYTTIRNYTWKGGTPRIATEVLFAPKEQGGLRLFDLEKKDKALKIQWVKAYFEHWLTRP